MLLFLVPLEGEGTFREVSEWRNDLENYHSKTERGRPRGCLGNHEVQTLPVWTPVPSYRRPSLTVLAFHPQGPRGTTCAVEPTAERVQTSRSLPSHHGPSPFYSVFFFSTMQFRRRGQSRAPGRVTRALGLHAEGRCSNPASYVQFPSWFLFWKVPGHSRYSLRALD